MSTKLEIINEAYSRMRISGLTKQPSGEDITTAMHRLENMAAEWEEANVCTGYNFEDDPDVGSTHNVPRAYWSAYESNLAMRLLADFGKEPAAALVKESRGTFSRVSAATAKVSQIQYPNRQPVGSGNTLRNNSWQRFYHSQATAPNECATVQMLEGEIDIRTEHFDAALVDTETVSSYTIVSDYPSNLTITADALASPDITYTVEAVDTGIYVVTITATTSLGRVFIRKVNYVVSEG